MKYTKYLGCACLSAKSFMLVITLSGCEQPKIATPKNEQHQVSHQSKADALQLAFEQWQKTQDQQTLVKYQTYLSEHLKHPPSLFELSYNRHIAKAECKDYQFAIAPEEQWKNIVQPLQLIDELQTQDIIAHYKIVSIYRGEQANLCSRGAKYSKHLSNHAVDIQLIKADGQLLIGQDQASLKQICQFWHTQGRKNNMGLGTYANNKFHIDTDGYRTWGQNYKRESSLCLS